MSIGKALAQTCHDFKIFLGDFTSGGAVWFLTGFFLAIALLAKAATEATLVLGAPHRRRYRARWSTGIAKSNVALSPAEGITK
jgi:hypothetical protein